MQSHTVHLFLTSWASCWNFGRQKYESFIYISILIQPCLDALFTHPQCSRKTYSVTHQHAFPLSDFPYQMYLGDCFVRRLELPCFHEILHHFFQWIRGVFTCAFRQVKAVDFGVVWRTSVPPCDALFIQVIPFREVGVVADIVRRAGVTHGWKIMRVD